VGSAISQASARRRTGERSDATETATSVTRASGICASSSFFRDWLVASISPMRRSAEKPPDLDVLDHTGAPGAHVMDRVDAVEIAEEHAVDLGQQRGIEHSVHGVGQGAGDQLVRGPEHHLDHNRRADQVRDPTTDLSRRDGGPVNRDASMRGRSRTSLPQAVIRRLRQARP
jgi:hypothetical protein